MNNLEARRMAAQLSTDLPTLDLHGLYPAEALDSLELFLYNAYQSGALAVHVVCGIGSGQLLSQVDGYLQKHPFVEEVFQEAGKCIVLFGR
jgi:DNA-nicking Smr family endonuclease